MPVDAGKTHAVRQYDITDYNKYCYWCSWGEVTNFFFGGGEVPPPKWPVCNTGCIHL